MEIYSVARAVRINEELRGAARLMATRKLKGKIGDPLPQAMSGEAVNRINADIVAFQALIREVNRG